MAESMKFECAYDELLDLKSPKIKPNPKNNNKHPADQIERLAKIIAYQGQRSPIVISTLSGLIVKGHARFEAIRKLKWEKIAVDFQDYESEEQEYADMTADNAIALWADLDLSAINESLGSLGPDFDIDLLGIANFKIDVAENGLTDEDAVPEPPAEPKTKLGDIYHLGAHRLMCGDSTSIDAIEKLMDGKKADMVFTDPPYGYQYESNYQKKHKMLENDDKILDFFPNAFSAMSNNSTIFVCGSHQTICDWKPLLEQNFNYKNLIVWKKNNWSMGDLKGSFAGQHELILYGTKGHVELIGERSRDIWEFDRDPPKDHPTQKPIALIEFAIGKVTLPEMLVLDFFGGSGSTLIACEKTGRKCFMMELDPRYCDVIVSRWEEFTGKKAELITPQT